MSRLENPTSPQSTYDGGEPQASGLSHAREGPVRWERSAAGRSFARGALEAAWIAAIFAALGLGYAEILKRAPAEPAVYAPIFVETRSPEDPSVWLVDGFNAVQRTLLGGRERDAWWTARRREELLERAARFDDPTAEVWVVFDGSEEVPDEPDACGPRLVFAPSADDWLVARVRAAEDPGRIAVVTADQRLAGRARRRGARVVDPSEFLRRCSG